MAGGSIAVAEELSQNIRDQFLQCKVCLDALKEPKTLPCLHTFCSDCLQRYIQQNSYRDGRNLTTFSCPICRRHILVPIDGANGFPDSFFVRSLSDVLVQTATRTAKSECAICIFKDERIEAKMMCIECRVELCDSCTTDHQHSSLTAGHTLLHLFAESAAVNRENYCRLHKGETVKYYCESCNSPVCLPCTFLDHKGHSINEIRRVREQFCDDMETLVTQSEDNIIQLQAARDDLAELENELFIRKEAIKTQIRRTLHDFKKSIDEQEAQLLDQVEASYDTVPVSIDRQKVEKTIYRLQRAHDFARQLMSCETSPITQLVNRSEAKDNLSQAQIYELPDFRVHLSKLDSHVCFLPGQLDICVGKLLKCGYGDGGKMSLVPPAGGVKNRALFVRKLNTTQSPIEVVTMAFLPNAECAILTTIQKFVRIFDTRTGLVRREFGDTESHEPLVQPADLAVTRDGDLAIIDCELLCVKVFDCHGSAQMTFGNSEIFALPIALAIDSIGRFLVCDQVKQRVTVHRQHGELLQTLDICELSTPQSICTFGNKLYIADCVNNQVAVYLYGKDGVQFVGKLSAGQSSPDFLDCSGICVNRVGNLLVSDGVLNRLHLFNSVSGEIGSVAAYGRSFYRSSSLAVSSDGLMAVYQQRGGGDLISETSNADDENDNVTPSETRSQVACSNASCSMQHEIAIYRLISVDP